MENGDSAVVKLTNYEFLLWKVVDRLKKKRAAKLNEKRLIVPHQQRSHLIPPISSQIMENYWRDRHREQQPSPLEYQIPMQDNLEGLPQTFEEFHSLFDYNKYDCPSLRSRRNSESTTDSDISCEGKTDEEETVESPVMSIPSHEEAVESSPPEVTSTEEVPSEESVKKNSEYSNSINMMSDNRLNGNNELNSESIRKKPFVLPKSIAEIREESRPQDLQKNISNINHPVTSNIHPDLLVHNGHPSSSSSSLHDDTTSIHLAQSDNTGTKQDTHPIYAERDRCLVDDRETDTKSLSNDCEKENIDSNEVPAAEIRGIHTNNSQDCPSKLKKYSERADFTNESYEPPIKIPKSVDGMKIVPVLSRKPIKKSQAMRPPMADWSHNQKERQAQNIVNPSTVRKQSLNLPFRILELRAKQRGQQIGNTNSTETVSTKPRDQSDSPAVNNEMIDIEPCEFPHNQKKERRQNETLNRSSTVRKMPLPSRILELRAKQRGHQIGNTIATETVSDEIMSLVEDEIIVIDHCESHHHDQKEEMRQREAQNMVNPSSTIRKQSLNLPARILELRAKQRGLEIRNPVTTEIAVDQSLNPSSTVRNLPLPSGILEARAHAKRQEGKICSTASEETVEIPSPMIPEKASTQPVCNVIDTLVNPPVNDPIDVPSTSKSAKSTQTSTV